MRDVRATRAELLATRRQIALADRAHTVLKRKLDGLILELSRRAGEARLRREALEERYREARDEIAAATMMEGVTGVMLAAFSVEEYPTIGLTRQNVFGVILPELEGENIHKTLDERGYGLLGTASVIDDAADAFEDLIEQILATAEAEGSVTRLVVEIERMRRRVNALEFKVLPDLLEKRRAIELRRDELEREERTRLLRIKKIKERRAAEKGEDLLSGLR